MDTRSVALVSVFSATWVASQFYLGTLIGGTTSIHGVAQRFVGWLLMIVLAELAGRFGRVSAMATVAALATRMIRLQASLYVWTVGLGYILGGLTFDLMFFLPAAKSLTGNKKRAYILTASLLSGALALTPYISFKMLTLLPQAVGVWLATYIPNAVLEVALSVAGTLTGLSFAPLIKPWSSKRKNDGLPRIT